MTSIFDSEPEVLSPSERQFRKYALMAYRFILATMLSYLLHGFLFSPIWMHGYLWSLNQPVDVDLSDKNAGFIVDRQMSQCGIQERVVHAIFKVSCVLGVLALSEFNAESKSTSWRLLGLSIFIGISTAAGRCLMIQQRLLSILHDGFYSYLNFFIIGLCFTLQFDSPKVKESNQTSKSKEPLKSFLKINKKTN